jgi:hypothetical protein
VAPAEPIDLLALAGGSIARRSLPGVAVAALEWRARRDDRL